MTELIDAIKVGDVAQVETLLSGGVMSTLKTQRVQLLELLLLKLAM